MAFLLLVIGIVLGFYISVLYDDFGEKWSNYESAEMWSSSWYYWDGEVDKAYDKYEMWRMIAGFLLYILGTILFALMLIVLNIKEDKTKDK